MIHAFNFTCDRDNDLSNLMMQTLFRHCHDLRELSVINTDHNEEYKDYGNGAGWKASMLKLNRLRKFNVRDDDFILSVDSDVVFGSPDVFIHVNKDYGIIGHKHNPEYHTHFGPWSHMGGSLIFIRGDVARRMGQLSESELTNIRYGHFKAYRITENEDIVLSYLARYVGANYLPLPDYLTSGNFESEVRDGRIRSYYHLNYCPTMFLDEPVTGKWDIPAVLEQKRIFL